MERLSKEVKIYDLKEETIEFENNIREDQISAVRKQNIERMKLEKRKQEAFRNSRLVKNLKVFAVNSAIVVSLLAGTFALKKQMDYVSSPVIVVTDDILSNVGLNKTDNNRPIDSKKFNSNDTEELYQYISDNNIEPGDIEKEIRSSCISDDEYDYAIEKINEMYPGLGLSVEKSKGL